MNKELTKKFLYEFGDISFEATLWDGENVKIGRDKPDFTAVFNKPLNKFNLLKSTSLELGEAYMRGDIDVTGDLYDALDKFLSQFSNFSTSYALLPHIFKNSLSPKKQKKDVSSHYDLGNDFYKLWLDKTLSYSCAYFINDTDTLYEAQCNKIEYCLKKMHVESGDSILDIGCGWGELLIYAAKRYDVKGLGITLSKEQYNSFKRRIIKNNLSGKIDVKLLDYRELDKLDAKFDKVVSIGMLEHVGRDNYKLFFENVNSVLKPKGVFLLHFISALRETNGDAWIKKYIFPGGIIPTLREVITTGTDFKYHTIDVESLRLHYNKTLLCWYNNFNDHEEAIKNTFDETFVRMWRLYLAACAAMFKNGYIDLHQIIFTKGTNNALPVTRHELYS